MNYALLIDENKLYPVNYVIDGSGNKIKKKCKLKGSDLTENQIKELYFNNFFDNKH